jgi:hypothetical protein
MPTLFEHAGGEEALDRLELHRLREVPHWARSGDNGQG